MAPTLATLRFPRHSGSLLLAAALVLTIAPVVTAQTNILLIVADDVGVDRVGAYGEHPNPGKTPNIDRLAAGGVLFRNC